MSTNLSDSNENMLVEYQFLFVYNSASKSSILHTMAFEFDIEPALGAARAFKNPISFRHGAWATLFEIASLHTPV